MSKLLYPLTAIECGKFNSFMHCVLRCHSTVGIIGSLTIITIIVIIIIAVVVFMLYQKYYKTNMTIQSKLTSF